MTKRKKEYRDYLESDHWQNLRKEAFAKYGSICSACCEAPAKSVHHLRYLSFYNITVEDVRPVCGKCHSTIHKLHKKARRKNLNYFERWLFAIKEIQAKIKTRRKREEMAKFEDWSI